MNAAVRVAEPGEIRALVPGLAEVLADCVAGGASVSFMAPFGEAEARAFWSGIAEAAERGAASVVVAETDGRIAGTVIVAYDMPPNQPHRADIRKLLVHRRARRRGLGAALMAAAEDAARSNGRTLLCLDTASATAEGIYARLGWTRVGVIPDYALLPEGGFCDTTIFYKRI